MKLLMMMLALAPALDGATGSSFGQHGTALFGDDLK